MKEFNLNSAEKYKDGSPMMTDLPVQLVRLLKRIELLEKKVRDDEDCIEICEDDIEDLDYRLEEIERKMANIMVALKYCDIDSLKLTLEHTGKDFCGNCTHSKTTDGICTCKLNKGITDPDDSSCPWFEPPFSASNQLDKKLKGKPDREECKHCPKSQCDNCMNFPF